MFNKVILVCCLLIFPALFFGQGKILTKTNNANENLDKAEINLEVKLSVKNSILEVYIHNNSSQEVKVAKGYGLKDLDLEFFDEANNLIKEKELNGENDSSKDEINVVEGSWRFLTIPKGKSLLFKKIDLKRKYNFKTGLYKLTAKKDVFVDKGVRKMSISSTQMLLEID